MSNRTSVQDAVRIIVSRNPYLYRGLRMRVVNYSALARYIQEEVENVFGENVDPNTIVTAIMRLSNQIFEPEELRNPFSGSRINLITGVSEVLIRVPPIIHGEVVKKIADLKVFDNYMTSLRQSSGGIRLLTNSSDAERLREALSDHVVDVQNGFAEMHVKLPSAMMGLEGALTIVVDSLAQNGVQTVDTSISENEINLVLQEEDAGRAIESLRALMR
jgi:aspartokinase